MFTSSCPPDCTLQQESHVRLAQTPVGRPSQGGTVSLEPAGSSLDQLLLSFSLLTVNLVCREKLVGEEFLLNITFDRLQSPLVLVYTPLSVLWGQLY